MYNVVRSDSLDDLIEEVNMLILDGWKPSGSLVVIQWEREDVRKGYSEYVNEYFQAMINEELLFATVSTEKKE